MTTERRRRFPLELIGLLVLVGVVAVGAVMWFMSPSGRGELVAPSHSTLGGDLALEDGVTDDGTPYLGRADAPVTLVEIADYQCPFCRDFAEQRSLEFMRDYVSTGRVRWLWLPVGFDGRESLDSAVASLCALQQGQFWPYHDWLFANASVVLNSGAFSRERLLEIAERLELDNDAFEQCLDDPGTTDTVLGFESYARQLGVRSTPTFVLGERLVEGLDTESLERLIEEALRE